MVMVKAQRHATADHPHDASSADWYFNDAKSGGFLIEQSVHNLDACNWAIGNHPLRGAGFGGDSSFIRTTRRRATSWTRAALTFEYPNGVHMTFTQNVFHRARVAESESEHLCVWHRGRGGSAEWHEPLFARFTECRAYTACAEAGGSRRMNIPRCSSTAFEQGLSRDADIVVGATAALHGDYGARCVFEGKKIINWSDFGYRSGLVARVSEAVRRRLRLRSLRRTRRTRSRLAS